MARLGGFHTSRPFLQSTITAPLTARLQDDTSLFERALQREKDLQKETKKATDRLKKELEKVKKSAKNKQSKGEEETAAEEEVEDNGLQNQAKTKQDPMLQAVQNQAKTTQELDSFRRGSHFGAHQLRTREFGTHPLSERSWDLSSDAIFVSLKPLAAAPVEGFTRLNGHVPKGSRAFWRTTPGTIRKIPEPPPKRTIPRLEPADHETDPFDHPPSRSWLKGDPTVTGSSSAGGAESGMMVHTFTSYARRKKEWPGTDTGTGSRSTVMYASLPIN